MKINEKNAYGNMKQSHLKDLLMVQHSSLARNFEAAMDLHRGVMVLGNGVENSLHALHTHLSSTKVSGGGRTK